ncbi:hypothetical protein ACS0TY_019342 [Phlomoides rotata]
MWKLKIAEGSSPWLRSVNGHVGRQTWEFDPSLGSPEELAEIEKLREQFHVTRFEKKHSSDFLTRLQLSKENTATTDITEEKVTNTLRRAISFHSTLQAEDGHWPGDYGGPMFLFCPSSILGSIWLLDVRIGRLEKGTTYVITLSITGTLNAILTKGHQCEIRRYLYNHQNRDGGRGLHIEGPSTMFGSILTYVTLRLLGEGANDGDGSMEKVLGAFEWSGINPLPPEIWLPPYILPIHPDCGDAMNDDVSKVGTNSASSNSRVLYDEKIAASVLFVNAFQEFS